MFGTPEFWRDIFYFFLILVAIFFVVNKFILSKRENATKKQNILINVLLGVSLIFIFYRIYKLIPEILNPGEFFTQNIINNLLYVCVLALATTGIVLIFKTSNTTNFAQGMIAAIGAFVAAKVVIFLGNTYTEMGNTLMVLLAMLAGSIIAFGIGICIDVFIIRNSKLPTAVGKQMITMGLVLIITGLIPIVFGTVSMSLPAMIYGENVDFSLLGMDLYITQNSLLALGITFVLLVTLFSMLRFTKWGLGVRATASNETVASMMGVNTKVITAMSWAIAGLLGAVAAVMWAPNTSTVEVTLMISTQVNGFMAAILGSFGSFAGPLLASVLIPILNGLLTMVATGWENAIVYAFILIVVLVKPLGLFGKQVAKKV
ncbi:MAG: branched-chain amino acid ABC transporter permease [Sphaerochaetaceae bacterium]|nr:branched-chain amino acid ABC transporter permease [Sphaerochaetaceae bacterium]